MSVFGVIIGNWSLGIAIGFFLGMLRAWKKNLYWIVIGLAALSLIVGMFLNGGEAVALSQPWYAFISIIVGMIMGDWMGEDVIKKR